MRLDNKKNGTLLFFIFILAFILRIYGINWGLPSKGYYFSYHSDEVHYIRGLSQMNPKKFDFNPHFFNWGTWHYYELSSIIGLTSFLNLTKITKDKYFYYSYPQEMAKIYLAGRFLSVCFALATVFLVFLIGKKIYGIKTGLLASFFLAISPAHIVHSHYLKADTSVTFWILLLLLCSIYLLETGKLKWYILSGIFSGIAFGSQQNGICFIFTLLFVHLLKEYKTSNSFNYIINVLMDKKLWIGYLATLFTYLIISPYLYLSTGEFISGVRNVLLRQGGGIDSIERTNVLIETVRAFNVGLTPFFVILGIIGIICAIILKSKKNLLVVFWLLPYLLLIVIIGALNTRHQILIYPGVFLLTAGAIQFFYSKTKFIYLRGTLILFIILSSFYTLIYSYAYDKELAKEKTIQLEASEWLILNVPAKTQIGIPSNPEIRHYPTIIHQDYYYREESRYKIINLNSSINNLRNEQPEYLIFDKKAVVYNNETDLANSPDNFMKEVNDKYKIVKIFERWPSFFLFSFKSKFLISDWEMPFPVICILERKT